ncbi:MAG: hypothetical protein Q9160_006215 [Pyrenula sp. 1 TL-2023]
MEVIAAASSILTITAAVGQSISVAKRLHDLLEDFRNAPNEIRTELEQLESFASTLKDFENIRSALPMEMQSLDNAIQKCHASVRHLEILLLSSRSELESERKRTRLRGHFRTIWREKRMEHFRRACAQTKSDLLLATGLSLM